MTTPILTDVHVTGPRALLRPVRAADAALAFPLLHGQRAVLDWLVWQGPADEGELRERYTVWRAAGGAGWNYQLAVVERASERFAGTLTLRCLGHPSALDLGYWLGAELHGRGLGTDAVLLATRLAVGPLAARVVTAEVFVGNHASARVLEKVGFTREAQRATRPLDGAPGRADRARWMYSLAAAAWRDPGPPADGWEVSVAVE
jgi:RimJ/RimL family protein N-acetyltransferase